MSQFFSCPYLHTTVELSEERLQYIIETHPGTLPEYLNELEETLATPDLIRGSDRDSSALLFSKWFQTLRTGRYLVVMVVHQMEPPRNWIVTTYTARKITGGQTLWRSS